MCFDQTLQNIRTFSGYTPSSGNKQTVNIYICITDNISISMYVMCVILCLFRALSRRLDALQITIIIIIMIMITINLQTNDGHRNEIT